MSSSRCLVSLAMLVALACTTPSTADSADTGGGGGDTGGDPNARTGDHYFPDGAPWTTPVEDATVAEESETLIAALQERNWGMDRFQIDFSMDVLSAEADVELRSFTPTGDFYSPDCDNVPMPVPAEGNLEGESGYACSNGGDCHLLVRDEASATLYEMWRADLRGDTFRGGCLAVWSMDTLYPAEGRGDQCTSADAAGYPISPLLFSADEVAAGEIDHAIRFILPNDRIRDGEFVHPASHATNSEGGGADAMPYGARLRLRADFDMERLADPDARVVAEALQRYGMFLADGGNVALTARSDARTTAKWDSLFEEGSHALVGIEPDDFEVLAWEGEAIPLTFECERNGL